MMRFEICTYDKKRCASWVLPMLASFPYNWAAEFPEEQRAEMLAKVVAYVRGYEYKKNGTYVRLGATHKISYTESSVTVATSNGVPQLSIALN